MPTPIGHALAGVAVAWSAEPKGRLSSVAQALRTPLTLACMALAVLPDADLLYSPIHRTVTHSIGATILVAIVTAGVTGWVTGKIQWRIVLACAAAHATHLLLDWLGTDRNYSPFGIQLLWPFDSGWYQSGWDLFLPVERRDPFSIATIRVNLAAVAREVAILGSIVVAIWFSRRRPAPTPK
jgi:membrane-bound metal-dependent hydrolase YbcI (DUF457 family)